MSPSKALKYLSLLLTAGYLVQDVLLIYVFHNPLWWLLAENVVLALCYLSFGYLRAVRWSEIPLAWVAGFNAARVLDAALDFSKPLYFTASHAILVVLSILVGALAWLTAKG